MAAARLRPVRRRLVLPRLSYLLATRRLRLGRRLRRQCRWLSAPAASGAHRPAYRRPNRLNPPAGGCPAAGWWHGAAARKNRLPRANPHSGYLKTAWAKPAPPAARHWPAAWATHHNAPAAASAIAGLRAPAIRRASRRPARGKNAAAHGRVRSCGFWRATARRCGFGCPALRQTRGAMPPTRPRPPPPCRRQIPNSPHRTCLRGAN